MKKRNIISFLITFLLFVLFVVYPVSAEDKCEFGVDIYRCNPNIDDLLQECKNCIGDHGLEWCNTNNCENYNMICSSGGCVNPTCMPGQFIGDIDNDGDIDEYDKNILQGLIDEKFQISEELCCFDLNKDEKIDSSDVDIVDNIIEGTEQSIGTCDVPCIDYDEDGFMDIKCGGDDCDDMDNVIHPGAEDIPNNRVDEDCDGIKFTKVICELNDICSPEEDQLKCGDCNKDLTSQNQIVPENNKKINLKYILAIIFIIIIISIISYFRFIKKITTINK